MFNPFKIKREEKIQKFEQGESFKPVKEDVEKKTAEEKILLEEERVYREGTVSIKDIIAPSAMKLFPTYLTLGNKFVRTTFVVGYPRYIAVGWFTPIINLNLPLDVSMYFYPVRTDIILKQLKKKVGNLEAQILSDREKGAPRDPIRETALRDIEQLRDDLTQGIEHFFQFGLYVTIYSYTKEELETLTDDIESLF